VRRLVNVPVGARVRIATAIGIGAAWARPAGTYRLLVALDTRGRRWSVPAVSFRQPF
jgi:ribosomal protein L2